MTTAESFVKKQNTWAEKQRAEREERERKARELHEKKQAWIKANGGPEKAGQHLPMKLVPCVYCPITGGGHLYNIPGNKQDRATREQAEKRALKEGQLPYYMRNDYHDNQQQKYLAKPVADPPDRDFMYSDDQDRFFHEFDELYEYIAELLFDNQEDPVRWEKLEDVQLTPQDFEAHLIYYAPAQSYVIDAAEIRDCIVGAYEDEMYGDWDGSEILDQLPKGLRITLDTVYQPDMKVRPDFRKLLGHGEKTDA